MDPPVPPPDETPPESRENVVERNGRRNSAGRISQLIDRVNGRRPSHEVQANNGVSPQNVASSDTPRTAGDGTVVDDDRRNSAGGRRSSDSSPRTSEQAEAARRSSDSSPRAVPDQANGTRRNSDLNRPASQELTTTKDNTGNALPPQEAAARRNSLEGGQAADRRNSGNGVVENTSHNASVAAPSNEATNNPQVPEESGVTGNPQVPQGVAGSPQVPQEGAAGSPQVPQDTGSPQVPQEAVAERRRSGVDNVRRPSFQEPPRTGLGRRASQELDDFSQAAALISDLINRVSAGNETDNKQAAETKLAAAERREYLRRSSGAMDKAPPSPGRRLSIDGEGPGRPARRQWGSTRELSKESSDVESTVDDIEAEYIRDVMKKRRSTKENQIRDAMQELGSSGGVQDIHARLLALRLAVQDYELPMQLAYDELDELAANADRVKSAIEKNMTLLTIQIKRSGLRYMRSAFTAFTFYCQRKRGRRLAMKNATEYFQRRVLGRAFQAWRIFYLRMLKFERLQQSAEKFLRRHNLARIWRAWASLVKRRLREDERHSELQEREAAGS